MFVCSSVVQKEEAYRKVVRRRQVRGSLRKRIGPTITRKKCGQIPTNPQELSTCIKGENQVAHKEKTSFPFFPFLSQKKKSPSWLEVVAPLPAMCSIRRAVSPETMSPSSSRCSTLPPTTPGPPSPTGKNSFSYFFFLLSSSA